MRRQLGGSWDCLLPSSIGAQHLIVHDALVLQTKKPYTFADTVDIESLIIHGAEREFQVPDQVARNKIFVPTVLRLVQLPKVDTFYVQMTCILVHTR